MPETLKYSMLSPTCVLKKNFIVKCSLMSPEKHISSIPLRMERKKRALRRTNKILFGEHPAVESTPYLAMLSLFWRFFSPSDYVITTKQSGCTHFASRKSGLHHWLAKMLLFPLCWRSPEIVKWERIWSFYLSLFFFCF